MFLYKYTKNSFQSVSPSFAPDRDWNIVQIKLIGRVRQSIWSGFLICVSPGLRIGFPAAIADSVGSGHVLALH